MEELSNSSLEEAAPTPQEKNEMFKNGVIADLDVGLAAINYVLRKTDIKLEASTRQGLINASNRLNNAIDLVKTFK